MKLIKGYRLRSFIAVFAKMIEAVFELIMPLLMARLIDVGIVGNQNSVVIQMSIWLLVLTVLGYASSVLCQFTASQVAHRVGYSYRKRLFNKIQDFSEEDYDQFTSAMLVNRLTVDVNNVQDMINRIIRLGVRAPILMIGSVGALYYINRELALIMLATFPIFVAVVILFMWLSLRGHKSVTRQLDALSSKVGESLSGTRIIRAFSKQREDNEEFFNLNKILNKKQKFVGVIASLSSPLTSFMMNAVLVYLVYLGALRINDGVMTQGQIIAVINYCTQLVLTIIVSMNVIMIVSKGYTSYLRVEEVLNQSPSLINGALCHASSFDIEFEHVKYHYRGEQRHVLNDINMRIKQGSIVGIVGLTGSGKSTMVRLMSRFMDPSSGEIRLGGLSLKEYDYNFVRKSIQYISQTSQFIRGTLEDNILMGKDGDASQALMHAQGAELITKGLDLHIEEGGKNLSGGQRQRVNIARALASKPKVIIFDDSFSALDYLTDRKLRQSLKENYQDTTQIIISQRTSTVKDADMIVVMDKGTIQAVGTHETLLDTNQLYAKIHQLQQGGNEHDQEV